jgi:hypothetical protein
MSVPHERESAIGRCRSWVICRHAQSSLRGPLYVQQRISATAATGLLFSRLYEYTPWKHHLVQRRWMATRPRGDEFEPIAAWLFVAE